VAAFPMTNIWDEVLARIDTKVNRHSFYTWFKPTAYVADQGGSIVVRVPNVLFRDWLTKHYSSVLNEALGELGRAGASIAFVMMVLLTTARCVSIFARKIIACQENLPTISPPARSWRAASASWCGAARRSPTRSTTWPAPSAASTARMPAASTWPCSAGA